MAGMEFDAEHFIDEIRKRPAIWLAGSDEYADKTLRNKCWNELVAIFGGVDPKTISEREKREMIVTIRRKWKSFRDCFARENHRLKRAKVNGDIHLRKTQYIYYKQLSFLKQIGHENGEEPDPLEVEVIPEKNPTLPIDRRRRKIKKKVKIPVNSILRKTLTNETKTTQNKVTVFPKDSLQKEMKFRQIDVFPVTQGQPIPENDIPTEDSDKLFLLSLLEPLKSIPEHLRFGTKIEMMRVIQNAQAQMYCHDVEPENDVLNYEILDDSIDIKSPSLLDQKHLEPEMEITEFQ